MKMLQLPLTKSALIAVGSLALSAATSIAGPITFSTSVGTQPSNVGTITLTQVDANTVNVLFDLSSGYGIINTGGPHTPFAFSLASSVTGVGLTFIDPVNGIFSAGAFSLNLSGGSATPYGDFGIAIDSTGQNGAPGGYYGDLEFDLTSANGLSVNNFIANSMGYYFAADLVGPTGNTGSQAWKTPDRSVPDGGTTVLMLGAALTGLGMMVRRVKA